MLLKFKIINDNDNCIQINNNFQIRVLASDNGTPPRSSQCVVRVAVNHNLNAPVFPAPKEYSNRILETAQPGSSVFTNIVATDTDLYVSLSMCELRFALGLLEKRHCSVIYFFHRLP